ncbi:testis-expressed protein 33 [Suncus etruscus]|uniref:testis-expressed protein 33 n=1 Tax=Suncus etruscus TaxID=109475 RepID=UPI00211021A2|nr:testis-expressed protein 33 [Suncus etruscus]
MTTLARPLRSSKEATKDGQRTSRSPSDVSKLLSPQPEGSQPSQFGAGNSPSSPRAQVPLEEVPLQSSAASTCSDRSLDVQPGTPKTEGCRSVSTESKITSCEEEQQSQRPSFIPKNIRHKFGSSLVDQVVSENQAQKALGNTLDESKTSTLWVGNSQNLGQGPPSYTDYYDLGYSTRSNLFQGAAQETVSLMKASYTPEVIEKSVRDIEHWHGRKTDELGRWHQKNALNMSLQKALDEKFGEKSKRDFKS